MTFVYDSVSTPFGDAIAVFSDRGLVMLDLSHAHEPEVPWLLEGITRRLGDVPHHESGRAAELDALMQRYFAGEAVTIGEHLALDWQLVRGFTRDALQSILTIPWGETASYGEVAVLAGSPGAARAVGSACRNVPFSIVVPVHRVVRHDGTPGLYGAHPEYKRFMLALETRGATASHG
ncbi:methylated-DNA--[protein]-cysteine S-methyltransferase [Microbacterium sp. YY-01]|uniref:methylated-DNA--[protein]-cysteine S-methyltransferase n=1 Tax=Microbacterium sp. YY-01 TaxID=3421634 RepID=UPI003D182334